MDLDYSPWDTPDAGEFGHGEAAVLIRLLDLARSTGYKFHGFASERFLRAFPTVEAVLDDGHALDWLCKRPEQAGRRYEEARPLFQAIGHQALGFASKTPWPSPEACFPGIEELRFLSAPPGPAPAGLRYFPVETRTAREAARAGQTARSWTEAVRHQVREAASRNRGVTVVVRPQVLARFDPGLSHVREILDLAHAVGVTPTTLRDLL